MFAAFSLFVGLLSVAYGEPSACVVSKNEFTWDFKPWKGKSVGFTTDRFNYPPMMGNWTYQIDFCNHLILRSQDWGFGWDYGELVSFSPNTHYVPPLNAPYKEYGFGDDGPPCVDQSRAAITELFCDDSLDCTRFPGNNGQGCIAGDLDSICVCGVNFTQANPEIHPLCQGMVIYLLSHKCVPGELTPINPTPPPPGGSVAGTVVGSLFGVFAAFYVAGVAYNYFVHGARGASALPLYATCCGGSRGNTVNYDGGANSATGTTKAGGSYGSV